MKPPNSLYDSQWSIFSSFSANCSESFEYSFFTHFRFWYQNDRTFQNQLITNYKSKIGEVVKIIISKMFSDEIIKSVCMCWTHFCGTSREKSPPLLDCTPNHFPSTFCQETSDHLGNTSKWMKNKDKCRAQSSRWSNICLLLIPSSARQYYRYSSRDRHWSTWLESHRWNLLHKPSHDTVYLFKGSKFSYGLFSNNESSKSIALVVG